MTEKEVQMRRFVWCALALSMFSYASQAGDPIPRLPPLPGRPNFEAVPLPWNYKIGLGPERSMIVGAAEEHRKALQANLETVLCPLDSQKFCVKNFGHRSVAFNIWDPVNRSWMKFEVPALDRTEVHCGMCEGKAKVSFHNGQSQSVYWVKLGELLRVDWAEAQKVWTLRADVDGVLALDK